eukprot:464262-Rhodomonas_salina.2
MAYQPRRGICRGVAVPVGGHVRARAPLHASSAPVRSPAPTAPPPPAPQSVSLARESADCNGNETSSIFQPD